ncbi:MAG TPA: hypothetical protein DDY70_04955 [Clostridiales bacterium]|nr:hypothetical protein [Clostridiales bacterium]
MHHTFENQPRFFYIGKDAQGVKDLHYGELYKEHLLQIPIKYQDIDNSWDLIFALNDELSLLIDIDESEVIASEKLQKALEIAERVIAKEPNSTKAESMSVFLSAIKTAISYHSPLLIWW